MEEAQPAVQKVSEEIPKEPLEPALFSPVASSVIAIFDKKPIPNHEPKITVNRFVSEIANWYEKLRNAMDYRDEEVVLRASIERILKRRVGLKGTGATVADPLLKELVWGHYFPNGTLPESSIEKVAKIIDVWIRWRKGVKGRYVMRDSVLNEWMYQLMSSHIARVLNPQILRNTMSHFMYYVLQDEVHIADDTDEKAKVQIFLAVRRAYTKDDTAFLRFALFEQLFGTLSDSTVEGAIHGFKKGYREIRDQLSYKLKEKIYQYVKKQTPVFVILEDVLIAHKGKVSTLFADEEAFQKAVYEACEKRYKSIARKVTIAIVKSVVFLLVTKALFALP